MAQKYLLPLYERTLDHQYCLNCQQWVFPRTPIHYDDFLFLIVATAIGTVIATVDTGDPLIGQIVVGLLSGIFFGVIVCLIVIVPYLRYAKERVCPICNDRNFEQHRNRHRNRTETGHRQRGEESRTWNWSEGDDNDD